MTADLRCWVLVTAVRVLKASLLFPDIIPFTMFLHCSSVHSSFAAFIFFLTSLFTFLYSSHGLVLLYFCCFNCRLWQHRSRTSFVTQGWIFFLCLPRTSSAVESSPSFRLFARGRRRLQTFCLPLSGTRPPFSHLWAYPDQTGCEGSSWNALFSASTSASYLYQRKSTSSNAKTIVPSTQLTIPARSCSELSSTDSRPRLRNCWQKRFSDQAGAQKNRPSIVESSLRSIHSFVDFKKAFDRVWRAVLWQVLGSFNIETGLVQAMQAVYENSGSAVLLDRATAHGLATVKRCKPAWFGHVTAQSFMNLDVILTDFCQDVFPPPWETYVVRACHNLWQPLQNHPSGHLGGWATLWSAEEMLDGQH